MLSPPKSLLLHSARLMSRSVQLLSRSSQSRTNMPRDICKPGMHTYIIFAFYKLSVNTYIFQWNVKNIVSNNVVKIFACLRFPPALDMKSLWSFRRVSKLCSWHLPLLARGLIKLLLVMWHHKQLCQVKEG